jgi:hypothetical protein
MPVFRDTAREAKKARALGYPTEKPNAITHIAISG